MRGYSANPVLKPTSTPYVDLISVLARVHLRRPYTVTSMEPLLSALGCCGIPSRHGWGPLKLSTPAQPDPAYEAFTCNALLAAMRFHVEYATTEVLVPGPEDGFSILDGLLKNSRWKTCAQNEQDARNLIWLLITLSTHRRDKEQLAMCKLADMVFVSAAAMLNEWLQPDIPFDDRFDTEHLLQSLFGNAWCNLVYPQLQQRHAYRLATLVYQLRPPFLPGLLPEQPAQAALELPSLETI